MWKEHIGASVRRAQEGRMTAGAISVDAFIKKFPACYAKWLVYSEKRMQSEKANAEAKLATKAFRGAEAELLDQMFDDEVTGVPDDSGSFASMTRNWSIACNQDNRIEVEGYLDELYGDVEPFKTFVLDKFAIQAKLRADCESESNALTEDQLPEFLNLSTTPKLTVRGWEKKKQEMEA